MRIVLFFINFILSLIGVAIIVIGVIRKIDTDFISELGAQYFIENTIIAIGAFLLASAFLGIIGALVKIKWFFIIYGIIMLINHCNHIGLTAATFVEALKMREYINDPFTKKFQVYDNNTEIRREVNEIQITWKCCGMKNVTHWGPKYPDSCCGHKIKGGCTKKYVRFFTKDCKHSATEILQNSMRTVGTLAVIFSIVEFFVALWALSNHIAHSKEFHKT